MSKSIKVELKKSLEASLAKQHNQEYNDKLNMSDVSQAVPQSEGVHKNIYIYLRKIFCKFFDVCLLLKKIMDSLF